MSVSVRWGWLLVSICTGVTCTAAPAHAFEDVHDEDILNRGPTMGPIDAERSAADYVKKSDLQEVTGVSRETKKREDFNDKNLDFNPVFAEALPRWGMELRLSPYRPQFSNSKDGQALYDLIMVNQNNEPLFHGRPMMLALEADWYFLRDYGLLGGFGRVGYWRAQAASRACVAEDGTTPVPCSAATVLTSIAGQDTASFTTIPISLGAVYRFDALKRKTSVPLVLSAKVGLDGYLWFGESGGKRSMYNGHKAQGLTIGWQASAQASLNLDGLAKRALSRVRSRVHNYLFVELATVRGKALIGSDRAHRINFTDKTMLTVGFACDFI